MRRINRVNQIGTPTLDKVYGWFAGLTQREDLREDEKQRGHAIELGWTVDESKKQRYGLQFEKDEGNNRKVLWHVGQSYPVVMMWWHVADVIDGYFRNHRAYPRLIDALENE